MLTVSLAVVSEFRARLARHWLTQTSVHVLRCRTLKGIRCRGLDGFFAMATLDIGVVGLAARVVVGVGGEGTVGWGASWGVCFSVEFAGVVCGRGLNAGFVLVSLAVCSSLTRGIIGILTPPCSKGPWG